MKTSLIGSADYMHCLRLHRSAVWGKSHRSKVTRASALVMKLIQLRSIKLEKLATHGDGGTDVAVNIVPQAYARCSGHTKA